MGTILVGTTACAGASRHGGPGARVVEGLAGLGPRDVGLEELLPLGAPRQMAPVCHADGEPPGRQCGEPL